MPSEIRTKNITKATFTCTLASLGNGSARQSTMIDNSSTDYPAAIVYLKILLNATTSADGSINVYLLRGNDPSASDMRTDGAGASDAALTVRNAYPLGSIFVPNGATSSTVLTGEFDTSVAGPLGPEWGIAVENKAGSSVILNATEGNHYKGWVGYLPESQ